MSVNQVNDDGAVIGYQPILDYKKEVNSNTSISPVKQTGNAIDFAGNPYSNALSGLIDNKPSTVLGNIENTQNYLNELVDGLTDAFKEGEWENYKNISTLLAALKNKDSEYTTAFVDFHANNIHGSIIPELIKEIYNQKDRLELFTETFKELFYGKTDIDIEQAIKYDEEHVKKLKIMEEGDHLEKINYMAISMDSILCKAITLHSIGVNKKATELAKIGTEDDGSFTINSSYDTIKLLYGEINNELKKRQKVYNTINDTSLSIKSLYNYYNKRQALLLINTLFEKDQDSISVGRRLVTKQHDLADAIANVARSIKANEQYMSKLTELEKEKGFLMHMYSKYNYNT